MLILGGKSIRSAQAPSLLKSNVQYVRAQIPAGQTSIAVTINSVTTGNTRLYWGGCSPYDGSGSPTLDKVFAKAVLTNSTTVTVSRNTSDSTESVFVTLWVVEYISGVITQMQRGSIAITNTNTSNTASVTTSSATLSELQYLGQTTDYTSSQNQSHVMTQLRQDSTTQLSANRVGSSGGVSVSYELATYSSTYVDTAIVRNQLMNTTNDSESYELSTPYFDNDIIASWGGQTYNTSNTDYSGDCTAVDFVNARGLQFMRGAFGPNSVNVTANVIAFKPGYIRRRNIQNKNNVYKGSNSGRNLANSWPASGESLAPTGTLNVNKSFKTFLGFALSGGSNAKTVAATYFMPILFRSLSSFAAQYHDFHYWEANYSAAVGSLYASAMTVEFV